MLSGKKKKKKVEISNEIFIGIFLFHLSPWRKTDVKKKAKKKTIVYTVPRF